MPESEQRVSDERIVERIKVGLDSLPPGRRDNPPEEIRAWLDLRDARAALSSKDAQIAALHSKLSELATIYNFDGDFAADPTSVASTLAGSAAAAAAFVERIEAPLREQVEKANAESGECSLCGILDCPLGDPLHYHHDGCPSEYVARSLPPPETE